mmetsp:Transcript_4352/g.9375  ORF Transcript_4352/g.9375 Transcript_4352/m.9375 type:complete len:80 (+) Transcript_4352:54-293(+)
MSQLVESTLHREPGRPLLLPVELGGGGAVSPLMDRVMAARLTAYALSFRNFCRALAMGSCLDDRKQICKGGGDGRNGNR